MSWIGWMLNKKLHIPLGHMQKKKKKKISMGQIKVNDTRATLRLLWVERKKWRKVLLSGKKRKLKVYKELDKRFGGRRI